MMSENDQQNQQNIGWGQSAPMPYNYPPNLDLLGASSGPPVIVNHYTIYCGGPPADNPFFPFPPQFVEAQNVNGFPFWRSPANPMWQPIPNGIPPTAAPMAQMQMPAAPPQPVYPLPNTPRREPPQKDVEVKLPLLRGVKREQPDEEQEAEIYEVPLKREIPTVGDENDARAISKNITKENEHNVSEVETDKRKSPEPLNTEGTASTLALRKPSTRTCKTNAKRSLSKPVSRIAPRITRENVMTSEKNGIERVRKALEKSRSEHSICQMPVSRFHDVYMALYKSDFSPEERLMYFGQGFEKVRSVFDKYFADEVTVKETCSRTVLCCKGECPFSHKKRLNMKRVTRKY